jgi:hypothetical protein
MSAAPPDRIRFSLHQGGQVEAWNAPHRFKTVVAGRRWGKTLFARTWLVSQALKKGAGRYWFVAQTREDAKDIMWVDLKAAVHPSWLADAPREGDLSLSLTNGAEIRLWSAEKGDSLRGRALKALVMDEYADMEKRLFHEILAPSLADFRAPALFIGTPKSYNHFYEMYERGQASDHPNWGSWQFRSVDNPTLDPDEVEEARRITDSRTFRQEWEASFESLAGRAYYAFDRKKHVGPVELETGLPVCVSFDFNVHPATAIIGQAHGDEPWIWREVWKPFAGGEATRSSARGARELLDRANYHGPIRIYGDATGQSAKTTGPSDHAVLKDVFPGATWCIPNDNPHMRDRVAAVNARCETMDGRSHFRVDPSCKKLIGDLDQVIFAKNGDLDQKTNEELTHISDALGYWIVRDFPIVQRPVTVGAMWAERWL